MDNIIQQFKEKIILGIKEELDKIFIERKGDISQLIDLVDKKLKELGRDIIRYILEGSDRVIKGSSERKKAGLYRVKIMRRH